jgi:hypothetical protein
VSQGSTLYEYGGSLRAPVMVLQSVSSRRYGGMIKKKKILCIEAKEGEKSSYESYFIPSKRGDKNRKVRRELELYAAVISNPILLLYPCSPGLYTLTNDVYEPTLL